MGESRRFLRVAGLVVGVLLFVAACGVRVPTASPGSTVVLPEASSALDLQPATKPLRPLPAPGTSVRFDRWNLEEGLSQSVAQALLQDGRGFLWVGTEDGLNRFDGYEFAVFRQDPDDPHSLSANTILALHEGTDGAIWVGTFGGGLNRYDPETGQFTRYLHDPDNPQSLGGDFVCAVYAEPTGPVWAGLCIGGLDRLDPATGQWRHYKPNAEDPNSLSSDKVLALLGDGSGGLWVATAEGLNWLDPDRETWRRYRHDPEDPASLGHDRVNRLAPSSSGGLWLATYGGLDRFEPATEAFVHYRYNPDKETEGANAVKVAIEDSSGTVWAATPSGLQRLEPESGQWSAYRNTPGDPHSLSENSVVALLEDRSGGVWVGTYGGGLNRLDRQRAQFTHYRSIPGEPNSLTEGVVWSVYEDSAGVLWIGTTHGLDRFDRRTDEWRHYRHDEKDPHSLSSEEVVCVREDRQGVLWVGTSRGLNRFDPAVEQFTHYRYDAEDPRSLSNDFVWTILEDRQGVLWVGTANGLNEFDRETGQFTSYKNDPADPNSLSQNRVWALYEDRSGTLWAGTVGGLNRVVRDGTGVHFVRYQNDPADPGSLSNNSVLSIYEDRAGRFWIGTWGGGLDRFEPETGTFAHLRVKDGLPNDTVYGILEDDQGQLWLSTNFGLCEYDPERGIFRNFDAGDGLQSLEFDLGAYYRTQSGEMLFGGINGVNIFHPDGVQPNSYVPPVVLTEITQGGTAVDLGKPPEALTDVTFHWPKDDFEFEFAALSFFRPEKNQYAYRLEGYDDDWHQVGNRRVGGYTNLPGGTYTLRILGANNDGLWNTEGVALPVTIVPPFWATWWFRGVLALVAAAAVAGSLRWRLHRVESQRQRLEHQVAERTQELAQRTKELAALNTIATAVSRTLDLQQVLDGALAKMLEVIGLEAGGIYLLEPEKGDGPGVLRIAAHRGLSPEVVASIDGLVVGEGFSGRVVQSCEPMVVHDLDADPRLTRSAVAESGFRSVAIAPVVSRAEVGGTLFVMSRERADFIPEDLELLSAIGGQIGVAIENARFFEAEQRRAEQFRAISETGHQITSILDIDQLLQKVVRAIRDAFGYYEVGIALVEGDELLIKASSGIRWQDLEGPPLRLRLGEEGIMGWVGASGQPLLVPDVIKEPRYVVWPHTAKTRSEVAVPLRTQAGVIGVLNVESDHLDAFDNSDLVVLQSLANQAAIAIENARFVAGEQRRAEQFRVIAEVGRRLTLVLDVDQVLSQVVRLVYEILGYYHVGIGLVEGEDVVYRQGAGELWDNPDFRYKPARLKVGREGLTGWVAASGQPLLVPDVSQDPRYVWLQGSKTQSELLVPIVVKGEVLGVLDAQSDRLNAFDDTDLTVLQSVAHQAGAAIENARLYEQAQQAAVMQERQRLARELHDAVTQTLFSASLIAEAVPQTWETDQAEGQQLLAELQQLTRGALAEMRTLLLELRPAALVEASLEDLFRQLAEAASGRMGVPVSVGVEGQCVVPPDVHVALYRIAQEALNNVVKHARATHAGIQLRCEEKSGIQAASHGLELRIWDDGRGFVPGEAGTDHLGLGIMRERADAIGAQLTVESRIGQGTEVRVAWARREDSQLS